MVESISSLERYRALVSETRAMLQRDYEAGSWLKGQEETYSYFKARARTPSTKPSSCAPSTPIVKAPSPVHKKPLPKPPTQAVAEPSQEVAQPPVVTNKPTLSFDLEGPKAKKPHVHTDVHSLIQDVAPHLSAKTRSVETPVAKKPHVLIVLIAPPALAEQRLLKDLCLALKIQGEPNSCVIYSPDSWSNTFTRLASPQLHTLLISKGINLEIHSPLVTSLRTVELVPLSELNASPQLKARLWQSLTHPS